MQVPVSCDRPSGAPLLLGGLLLAAGLISIGWTVALPPVAPPPAYRVNCNPPPQIRWDPSVFGGRCPVEPPRPAEPWFAPPHAGRFVPAPPPPTFPTRFRYSDHPWSRHPYAPDDTPPQSPDPSPGAQP